MSGRPQLRVRATVDVTFAFGTAVHDAKAGKIVQIRWNDDAGQPLNASDMIRRLRALI